MTREVPSGFFGVVRRVEVAFLQANGLPELGLRHDDVSLERNLIDPISIILDDVENDMDLMLCRIVFAMKFNERGLVSSTPVHVTNRVDVLSHKLVAEQSAVQKGSAMNPDPLLNLIV